MSIWYLPPFGPQRGIQVQGGAHVLCAKNYHLLLLLLLIVTAFKGKTTSRSRLASFGFRMSFFRGPFIAPPLM